MGRIDKETLEKLYITEKKTGKEIAFLYGYSSFQSVYNLLEKFNIPRRDNYEAQNPIEIPKEDLEMLYINFNLSSTDLARAFACSDNTILRLLKKFDIPRKQNTWRCAGWNKGIPPLKSIKEKISVTRKELYRSGELIHWNTGRTWNLETKQAIAKALKGRFRGEDNPNWKGGKSNEYKVWRRRINDSLEYREFRKSIFERDGFTCRLCFKPSNGNLEVHHIYPVEFYPELIMNKDNAITLHHSCHTSIRYREGEYAEQFKEDILHRTIQ